MALLSFSLLDQGSTLSAVFRYIAILTVASWILLAIWLFRLFVWWPSRSHLKYLPGPPQVGRLFGGHVLGLLNVYKTPQLHDEYREKYGLNMRVHGVGYFDERFLTFDPVAIHYVLAKAADNFPKPWQSRGLIRNLIGEGALKRRLRTSPADRDYSSRKEKNINDSSKNIAPAFSQQAVRALQPIFFSKAQELRQAIDQEVIQQQSTKEDKTAVVDVSTWAWRATFDIIGLAGFSHEFNCIKDDTSEMYQAYKRMSKVTITDGFSDRAMLEQYFPWIATLFPNHRTITIKESKETIKKLSTEIAENRKEEILRENASGKGRSRDILSLLINAHINSEDKDKLSDDELLNNIRTLLFVGSDTVSLSIAWALYYLGQNLGIQDKLRAALKAAVPSPASAEWTQADQDAIMSLPYLDQVVKETLRFVPAVHSTVRVAGKDDVIPTSDGTHVFIRKGQGVHVAIEAFNRLTTVWGPDAQEFKPERWTNLPRAAKEGPGMLQGLMTFSVGPHSCPGWQFAILEIKAVLAALVMSFVFEESPDNTISRAYVLLTRPFVKQEVECNSRLPLMVRRVEA